MGSITIGNAQIDANSLTMNAVASTAKIAQVNQNLAYDTRTVLTSDLNQNGKTDVIALNYGGPAQVFLNGSQGFGAPEILNGLNGNDLAATSGVVGDVNGDGKPDLIVGIENDQALLYLNNGTDTPFSNVNPIPLAGVDSATSLALGDVNGDGKLDLVAGLANGSAMLFLNNGTSNPFDHVTGQSIANSYDASAVALGDANGDGRTDLVVATSSGPARYYENTGDASQPFNGLPGRTVGSGPALAVAMTDITGNGRADLVIGEGGIGSVYYQYDSLTSTYDNGVTLGEGAAAASDGIYLLAVGDVNGNGVKDLVQTTSEGTVVMPYSGDPTNPFPQSSHEVVNVSGPVQTLAIGDLNGDGSGDLVFGQYDQTTEYYLSNPANSNPFAGAEPNLLTVATSLVVKDPSGFGAYAAGVVSSATATIDIQAGASIVTAGDVSIEAQAISEANATINGSFLGVTVATSTPTATVTLDGPSGSIGGASISAGGNVSLQAYATNKLTAKLTLGGLSTETASRLPATGDVGVAVGIANTTSTAQVDQGASIHAHDTTVLAQNTNTYDTEVTSGDQVAGGNKFGLGVAVALTNYTSKSNAEVDGTISSGRDTTIRADSNITSGSTSAKSSVKPTDAGTFSTTSNGTLGSATGKFKSLLNKTDNNKAAKVQNNSADFSLAAAVAISLGDNEASAVVGPTGDVTSSAGNLLIHAGAVDNMTTSAVGTTSKIKKAALGAGVGYTEHTNSATATVGQGASIDAAGTTTVEAIAKVPNQINAPDPRAMTLPSFSFDTSSSDSTTTKAKNDVTNLVQAAKTAYNDYKTGVQPYTDTLLGSSNLAATTYVSSGGSVSSGGDFGLGGGVDLVKMTNTATAQIDQSAKVNQRNSLVGGQNVNVNASADLEMIDIASQAKLSGLTKLFGGASGDIGVGGSIGGFFTDNEAHASIGAAARVSAGGDISVTTDTKNFLVNVVQAGADTKSFGVQASISYAEETSVSQANIEPSASINALGNLTVQADNHSTVSSGAGGLSKSDMIGVGLSGTIVVMNNTSKAFIGASDPNSGLIQPTNQLIHVGKNLNVTANSTQQVIGVAFAGSFGMGSSSSDTVDPTQPSTSGVPTSGTSAEGSSTQKNSQFGLGISGDAVVNIVTDTTEAYIDLGSQNVTVDVGGQLKVTANNTTLLADGVAAVVYGKSAGIGGSFTMNDLHNTTKAYASARQIDAGSVVIEANVPTDPNTPETRIFSVSATGAGSKKYVSLAGQVNLNELTTDTEAYLARNTSVTTNSGGTTIEADNTLDVWGVAGDVTISTGKASVGAALDLGFIDTTVKAYIDNNSHVYSQGNIEVFAYNTETIHSIAASISAVAGSSGAGVSGSASAIALNQTVTATIGNGAQVLTPASLGLEALDTTSLLQVGGSADLGGNVGVGASLTVGLLNRTVSASIGDNALVEAGGSGAGIADPATGAVDYGLLMVSDINDTFLTFAGAGAGAKNVGGAASVVYLQTNDTSTTSIGQHAQVNTPGEGIGASPNQSVHLEASHETNSINATGDLGFSQTVALTAAAVVLNLTDTTSATIGDAATVDAADDVVLNASSPTDILSIAAGIAGSGEVSLSGSAVVVDLHKTTSTSINPHAIVDARGSVALISTSTVTPSLFAGGLTIGLTASLGASATVLTQNVVTTATIAEDATVDAQARVPDAITVPTGQRDSNGNEITAQEQGVLLAAVQYEPVLAVAAGGSGGESLAIAASATVNLLDETTKATIADGARINQKDGKQLSGKKQDVSLLASDRTSVTDVAGDAAVALSGAGIGGGADVTLPTKVVEASIGTAKVYASQNVLVQARSSEDLFSTSVGFAAGADGASIAGAAGVHKASLTTTASIGVNATVLAEGSVVVSADDQTNLIMIAGQIAGNGTAAVGASAAVPIIDKTTTADVGAGAQVDALGLAPAVTVPDGTFTITYQDWNKSQFPLPGGLTNGDLANGGFSSSDVNQDRVTTENTTSIQGLAVTATSTMKMGSLAGSLGVSGTAAINAGASVFLPTVTTTAYIDHDAQINQNSKGASALQSVLVTAGSDFYHVGFAGSVSLSAAFSANPGADITLAHNTTTAFIGDHASVFANDNIEVVANQTGAIVSIAVGAAAFRLGWDRRLGFGSDTE